MITNAPYQRVPTCSPAAESSPSARSPPSTESAGSDRHPDNSKNNLPQHGRQIRICGEAASAGREASAADFLARSPASRAAAMVGSQSELLGDPAELEEAFRRSQAEVDADPDLVAPGWTLYALSADTVEFWQAGNHRRHIRLQYQRTASAWTSRLLWP
jgi:pyridoxamine 5'-phosphate oxidase